MSDSAIEGAIEENEGSNLGSANRSARGGQVPAEQTDRKFNLNNSKNILLAQIEETCSTRFKVFFKSSLMNRFLHTFILYFVSFFQLHALKRDSKGTRAEHAALARDMERQLQELAPVYATIIMQESDYHHTEQDKKFFEHLYDAATEILMLAFPGQRRQALLEDEIGRVMRTAQFNSHGQKRLNKGHISECTLSVRELYQIKHEGDPALNSRILSNLYQKKTVEGTVTLASISNTPLIGKIISPLDHGIGKNQTERAQSLQERMPWKYGRRGYRQPKVEVPGAEARSNFVSFTRAPEQVPVGELENLNRHQKKHFDEGSHRSRGLPLPGIREIRSGSSAGSLGSQGLLSESQGIHSSAATTARSGLRSADSSNIGRPSAVSRPRLLSQGSQRPKPNF